MSQNTSAKIVIAVSENVETYTAGSAPEKDYQRLAAELNAVVISNSGYTKGNGALRELEKKAALDISQARYVIENYPDADLYFSFSERVGIPLASFLRRRKHRPIHVMMVHRIHSLPKYLLNLALGWNKGVDRILTRCTSQAMHAERFLPGKCVFVSKGIDNKFFSPDDTQDKGYVLCVGSECRDYKTLIAAINNTEYRLKILDNSPWCRRHQMIESDSDKIEWLSRVSYEEMLRLYRQARLVVVPLLPSEYAAGVNCVLEAFCVNKPVVATETVGMKDYISHMDNCYIVQPFDVEGLTRAIDQVFVQKGLRQHLINGGVRTIQKFGTLDKHCSSLSAYLQALIDNRELSTAEVSSE